MIPKAYCPSCKRPMQPRDAMLGKCPSCSRVLDVVLVDAIEWTKAIRETRESEGWR